jgi:hypothetical protein
MNTFLTKELLNDLLAIAKANFMNVQENISILSDIQLHWKKDNLSWSLSEIAAHLNEFSSYYNTTISKKIENTRFREPGHTFVSSPLGRSAWFSMKLGNARNVKRKLRSPRAFNPRYNKDIDVTNSIQILQKHQSAIVEIINRSMSVSLRKIRIPMATSKLIRLRLGDALMYLVYHNERHVQQMLTLLTNKNFPQKAEA